MSHPEYKLFITDPGKSNTLIEIKGSQADNLTTKMGKVMNTVTQEHIDLLIKQSEIQVFKTGQKTCVVTLILSSGFEITASSACVDPVNYDEAMGKQICLKKIEDKLWELEGYLLQVTITSK